MSRVTITTHEYTSLCHKANYMDKLSKLNDYGSIEIPLYASRADKCIITAPYSGSNNQLYKLLYNCELWLFGSIN